MPGGVFLSELTDKNGNPVFTPNEIKGMYSGSLAVFLSFAGVIYLLGLAWGVVSTWVESIIERAALITQNPIFQTVCWMVLITASALTAGFVIARFCKTRLGTYGILELLGAVGASSVAAWAIASNHFGIKECVELYCAVLLSVQGILHIYQHKQNASVKAIKVLIDRLSPFERELLIGALVDKDQAR